MKRFISNVQKKIRAKNEEWCNAQLLKNIPKVEIKNCEKLFVFSSTGVKFYDQLYLLFAHELAQRGVPSCFLFKSDLVDACFPKLVIDHQELSNSLILKKKRVGIASKIEKPLQFEWDVDLGKKRIVANGINIFPIIRSNLRSHHKSYNIDFKDQANIDFVHNLITTCDLLFNYFLLLQKYGRENNIKIRIVGREPVYIPDGFFRILCKKFSCERDIEYIDLGRGYMGYFGFDSRESYISIVNFTKTKIGHRLCITHEEFKEFDQRNIDEKIMMSAIDQVLKKQKQEIRSKEQNLVIQKVNDCFSRGKKVFVLFAHLFYDTPINEMSPSFEDMCEWISETIAFFKKSDHLLILKPHPAEVNPRHVHREPNETLVSFVGDMVLDSNNIILLEPRLFSLSALSSFMSCGLVWRSSVTLELTYLRVPCIIAGNPPYACLDLTYAKSRGDYFDLIERSHELKVKDQQVLDVARYIYYFENFKHHHIQYLPLDKASGRNYWSKKEIKRYLKSGDKNLSEIVNQMLD